MPTICFDVFIPDAHDGAADKVGAAFQRALDILVDRGRLTVGALTREEVVLADDAMDQLRRVYENDHDGIEPGAATVHRYLIDAQGEAVSYNQLAMSLSRIFTAATELPADPVALEREVDFERGAIYPWMVEIRR